MKLNQQNELEDIRVYPAATSRWIAMLGILAVLFLLGCTVFGFLTLPNDANSIPCKCWKVFTLSLWILGVPIWFAVEYQFIYRKCRRNFPSSFEHFKHHQDLISKVWLACGTLLTALYFGHSMLK